MIDSVTFAVTLITTTGLLTSLTALGLILLVFRGQVQAERLRAPLINGGVAMTTTAVNAGMAVPTAIFNYSISNVGATILLVICVLIHYEMNADEAASKKALTALSMPEASPPPAWAKSGRPPPRPPTSGAMA